MFYCLTYIIGESITATSEFRPYYGEYWIQLGYIFPHFTYGLTLLSFLVNHGTPTIIFKLIVPFDMSAVWFANIFTIAFYICLYVYLDAVMPSKYGVR